MSNDKITELQRKIDLLEDERQRLDLKVRTMQTDYQSFIADVSSQIRELTSSIEQLRVELSSLKGEEEPEVVAQQPLVVEQEPEEVLEVAETIQQETVQHETVQQESETTIIQRPVVSEEPKEDTVFDKIRKNVDWEKFVGENLISKLGILILLIGVAIGGKYAIEHQMISPTLRIILGLVLGAGLQGVAFKLKSQYKNFSAILASGSVAILYFMTFFAYHLYGLIPMPVAFVSMMLITMATVWLACSYDREVIAIIGLVGAYVIPFALSTGEGGSPWVLFSYIAIINVGVMVISVMRYWRILFVSAFAATWLITLIVYRVGEWTSLADSIKMLVTLFVTFAIFYVTFLAYKVKHSMIFQHFDIHFLLTNSFLFFGLGYNVMYNNVSLAPYVGWFTFVNALLHAGVASVLLLRNMVDRSVSRLVLGLAISFLTIALMVWMTGHWLTMFWMMEATVLFTVSRLYHRPFYEKMSYPIFLLALVSLIIDWGNPNGGHLTFLTPLFHAFSHYRSVWDVSTTAVQGNALSIINTVVFVVLCLYVAVMDHLHPMVESEDSSHPWMKLASRCLTAMAIFVVTTALLVHIEQPWLTLCWSVEAVVLCYLGRSKADEWIEIGSYCVIMLATVAFLHAWANLSEYDLFYRIEHAAWSFSMSWSEMWQSAVAGLSLIGGLGGMVALCQYFRSSLLKEADAKDDWSLLLKRMLVVVLCFFIWTHTPWIITTILAFTLVLGCFVWMVKYDRTQKDIFLCVLIFASFCWLLDVCSGFVHSSGHSVMVAGTFVSTALIFCMMKIEDMKNKEMKSEEMCEGEVNQQLNVLFPKMLVLMPFVALCVVVVAHSPKWFCDYSLAYFLLWTGISLFQGWRRFDSFSAHCLCVLLVAFLVISVFDLQVENVPADYSLPHCLYLVLIIASCYVLYCYKKLRGTMFHRSEEQTTMAMDTLFYLGTIIVVGCELNNLCRLLGSYASFGLVFSVFLGIASLFGIYYGLYKDKKYLRIEGIVLLAYAILKLIFHDMKRFDTIYKTIAFVSLGVLMLVISFTYQKIAKVKEKAKESQDESKEE